MKKQLQRVLVLAAVLVLVMSGCGKKGADETTAAESSSQAAEREPLAPPVKIADIKEYVNLGQYKNIEMPKDSDELTEDEINEMILQICENSAEPEQIMDGEVKDGDTVHIDYVGKKDGVAFEGGSGTTDLTIGSGKFIDGFEEGLIGSKPGDTVDLNLTFPDPYPNNTELAGKAVVFTVNVQYICGEDIVPEFDDALASKLGFENAEKMRTDLVTYLQQQKTSNVQQKFENSVWQKAVENAEILKENQEIYDSYYDNFVSQYQSIAASYGMEVEQYLAMAGVSNEQFLQAAEEYATNCMKQELVCRAIADLEGMTVSEEEYQKMLSDYYTQYSSQFEDEAALEAYYGKERLENDVLWSNVIQMVIDSAIAGAPEETTAAESAESGTAAESTESGTAAESTAQGTTKASD